MVCCPKTTQIKNYPFKVLIAGVSAAELAEVRAKIRTLIG